MFDEQKAGRILGLYQRLFETSVPADDSPTQTELLLSGLVEKHSGYLRIKNPIYQTVFNREWLAQQLDALRPYSQLFNAWLASQCQDESRLLRGQALQEVLDWTQRQSLSDLDYRYLAASQEMERREVQKTLEMERLQEAEVRLALEQKSARRQRQLLKLLTVALIATAGFGGIALFAYRQSAASEVEAIAAASKGSFASYQRLDALVQAMQARRKFYRLWLLPASVRSRLDQKTHQALETAVYGADEANRIAAQQGGVLSVSFSPDGQWIATAGTDRTLKLWQRDGKLVRTFTHSATVYEVQFSPDSQRLIAAGLDGTVPVWSIEGSLLTTLIGHTAPIWGVSFSPDGQTIASTSGDRTIKLWRADGTLVRSFTAHQAAAWDITFSPDGQRLASTSVDNTIKLWNLDGTSIRTLENDKAVWSVAFSPDGQKLVSGGADNLVKVWSREGALLKTLSGHSAEVLSVAFSPDGSAIASGSSDKTLKLWNQNGELMRTYREHRGTVRAVAFSPDGRTLASSSADGTVKLWNTHNLLFVGLHNHPDVLWQVVYAPGNADEALIAGISSQEIRLWRSDGVLVKSLPVSAILFYAGAFSPTESTLAIAGASGEILLIDWKSGETTRLTAHRAAVYGLAYSPDGQFLVSAGDDRTLKLWQRDERNEFQLRQTLPAHTGRIWNLAFSPDGQFVATSSLDGTVKLWTWDTPGHLAEELHLVLSGNGSEMWGVAISPDSQLIAATGRNGQLYLWNRQGQLIRTLEGDDMGLTRVAFSPDGQFIAAGVLDNTVKLWSVEGTLLSTLSGHTSGVLSVTFSPDGKTLASGSYDRSAIVWNLEAVLKLNLLEYGCQWVRDYLQTTSELAARDRPICKHQLKPMRF
ncbi:sugar-binding protein [Geitlerinema splendidum]|nr:sugar-binding protein [Geitlerinema splendidum]